MIGVWKRASAGPSNAPSSVLQPFNGESQNEVLIGLVRWDFLPHVLAQLSSLPFDSIGSGQEDIAPLGGFVVAQALNAAWAAAAALLACSFDALDTGQTSRFSRGPTFANTVSVTMSCTLMSGTTAAELWRPDAE